tara:strand:- start:371 stop:772 length:402 start_codon:yes stop_codon:yes gene_type:complete
MTQGVVKAIEDKSEDGNPNYSIDLIDGTRLYLRGKVLNPMPNPQDKISYDIMNIKTSASGNQYTNIKELVVLNNNAEPSPATSFNKFDNSYKDKLIYVTGIVGRAMGSGNFSEEKIDVITERAVASFNKHLGK